MNGLLLIDKPVGWTSFDVVAKVRGTLSRELGHKIKVGHAGTLDPLASGLMILLIGSATKQADTLLKLDKSYEFTAQLGATTVTGDAEGEPKPWPNAKIPTNEQITEVLEQFTGEIKQRPHSYSAIKVGGQPAYKQARQGQPIELEPRKVVIHSLELVSYEYPKLNCMASVSSGTYIRSLAEDIGKALNCGAYLTGLRRTTIADYSVKEAISPDSEAEKLVSSVIPLE